jgi:hypothetical protein
MRATSRRSEVHSERQHPRRKHQTQGPTPDTTLTPPGMQYGAIQGKAQKRNGLRYAVFARLCNPLQRMMHHS